MVEQVAIVVGANTMTNAGNLNISPSVKLMRLPHASKAP